MPASTPESRDWYDTPLYYDIIFDADTEKEADFMEIMMVRHGRVKKPRSGPLRILEPACGSGRLVEALAKRGHTVCGFDLNEHMLDYSRERLKEPKLEATLWQDRMEDFKVPARKRFDLAHCLVSTFKYVREEQGAQSHLRRVADSLCQGGLYILGVHLTDYHDDSPQHESWSGKRDGIKVTCNTHTDPPNRRARIENLHTELRITREGRTWTQETKWQFRTYNATQMKKLLATAPDLELVACHDFLYEAEEERKLDDSYSDIVLVLRKR
jgi:SAM-dependent methyltransferase